MRIVERKQRFDPDTGQHCGHSLTTRYYRCDYCGEVLPASEGGCRPNLLVDLKYEAGCDTCFGSDGDEFALAEALGADVWPLLDQPYSFCNNWNDDGCGGVLHTCEPSLALELLASTLSDIPEPHPPEGMEPLRDVFCLEGAFRAARVRAARKLVADGKETAESLGALVREGGRG